jgi:uncharacterized protein YdbL (DUF1318 family)
VEGIVGATAALGIVERIDERVEQGRDGLEIAFARARAGEPNGLAFDGDASLQDVVEDIGLGRQAERQRLCETDRLRRAAIE